MAFLTASHVATTSGINLQSFVRTAAAAILILSKPEVTGYNDEYGPLYQKLNRLPGSRDSPSDDLIEVTRSACLTSDDLDCPEFKDTDDLLVPTTRSRSLTDDDVRHRMWSSSPKIKMNKGPDVYESSGHSMTAEEETTPCSNDDEDCLTFSGADELFFPTSEVTVALAVESTSATYADDRTSEATALFVTSTKALLASEASIVDLPTEEKNLRLSSKGFVHPRPTPTNTSFAQSHPDVNHLSNRNQQHDVNNYNYYSGSVGRSLEKLTINIGLILGIAFGIAVLLLVLAFALFKYRNQFGSGAVGEKLVDYQASKSVPLVFEPCKIQAQKTGVHNLQPLKVDVSLNLTQQQQQQHPHQQHLQSSSTPRKKDVKEWYV